MDDWTVNLGLAVLIFAVILLPQAIPWAPVAERRPLRDEDLEPPAPSKPKSD